MSSPAAGAAAEKSRPQVYNKYTMPPGTNAVYIGRGSPYGNGFEIGKDGDRDAVCDLYEAWLQKPAQEGLRKQIRSRLRGRNLQCFCTPRRCHGESILRIANDDA